MDAMYFSREAIPSNWIISNGFGMYMQLGVIGFTKSLGKELSEHNISVNCITPSVANTPILEQATKEHIEYMLSKVHRSFKKTFFELRFHGYMIFRLFSHGFQ